MECKVFSTEKDALKIKSNRLWEIIEFLIKESNIDNKDSSVDISIKKEDIIYITILLFFDSIENEIYEHITSVAEDKENSNFKLEKIKSTERFKRWFEYSKQIGINEQLLLEILTIRCEIEYKSVRDLNEQIAKHFKELQSLA